MPQVVADRVLETTATTGTGTLTLAGAVTGYQSFAAIGNANTCMYAIEDRNTGAWEVGIGTYTSSGTTLSRTTILASSNAGSAVSFAAGTKYVFATLAASKIAPGKETIWVPAGAMTPATTNGPGSAQVELTTNKQNFTVLEFDAATIEYAHFNARMPKSWDLGAVTFVAVWMHAATTTNFGVVWALQALALSDDDAADASWGTAVTQVDTGGTTSDIYHGPESSAVTIGGSPAAQDLVAFRFYRDATNGSDTMAIDARLVGVAVFLTVASANDA
jgi:hypothetical protein